MGRSALVETLEREEISRLGKTFPPFAAGDTVAVDVRVREGGRQRIQAFEGVVIGRRRRGLGSSFKVRRVSAGGEAVERTFQLYSPAVEGVRVLRHGRVRRAKLYYLRQRSGRSARIKEKLGAKREKKPS